MTAESKNVYIDKLSGLVNKYNNAYHRAIKTNPVDVKDNTYIDFGKEVHDNDPKFKVGDHVRISKYKNIFVKGYIAIGLKKCLRLKVLKTLFHGEKIIRTFYEKELQKTNQEEFKKKSHKLYFKWKGYDNSFNSWIVKRMLYKNESIFF